MSGSYLGKTAPKLVLVDENGDQVNEISEGQDVRIMSDDTAYLQKIVENGKIYLNGNSYQAVDQELYRLKDNILVLDSSLFAVDKDNKVTIKVDGYEDKVFNIAIAKDLKDVALEAGGDFKTGAEVTITNTADETGDIWKNLQSIVLTRPDGTKKTLSPDGQESLFEKIGYTINGASLLLGKDLFKEAGEYSVEISAQYYGVETVEFEVEKAEENPGDSDSQLKKAPSVKETGKSYISGYTITVGMGNDDWMKAITGVTVNEKTYEKGYYSENTYSLAVTDGMISLNGAGFTENENIVVISAKGYEDLEVVLDKSGKQVIEKASTMAIELPEMIVNTEIPVVNANPIKEEKPVVSEDISGKGSELSEKKVSGDETKEEDSEESTEDAEDIENSGDAEEAETENETETAAESEPNTEDAAEENVLEEAAEL